MTTQRSWFASWFALFASVLLALLASDGRAEVRGQQAPESLEIRGSGSVLPLAERVAEAYMTDHPDSIVVVSSGGNRRGLKSLILGTCEMAMAGTEVPEEIQKLAADNKVELVSADIYQDAVVVVVHPDNPIKNISMKQLRDVFRGAITNWSALGGKDAPIDVITHNGDSSTFEVFKRSVLGDDAVITPKAVIPAPNHDAFVQSITPTAIGYASLHVQGNLKVITVDGVEPDVATIASARYPIRRMLRLYQRKPESAIGKAVLDYFLAPDKGQAFVRQMGDVPVR
jgi:phosphate transport system substrate-binding protein